MYALINFVLIEPFALATAHGLHKQDAKMLITFVVELNCLAAAAVFTDNKINTHTAGLHNMLYSTLYCK